MRLFASVLHLDRAAIRALRITDPYSIHRVVFSLYEDVRAASKTNENCSSGILYSDQGGDFSCRKILMLANRPPAERVDGQYGSVVSKPIPDGFLNHQAYGFRITINPVRRDSATGKVIPIKGREAIKEWFLSRAPESWGFQPSPEHLQIDGIDVLQFRDKAMRPVTLAQAHVHGTMRVTERDQFHHCFANGIGRGRSFGCGLLQVFPLNDTL